MAGDHPHGLGNGDPHLRGNSILPLGPNVRHLGLASRRRIHVEWNLFCPLCNRGRIISSTARSRGYGLYYAITLGSGAVAPLVFGLVTDGFGLPVTMIAVASIVLATLPLSRFLSQPGVS